MRGEGWSAAEIVQAYHDPHRPVEPGLRWSKTPAAIAPVWWEKPERMAAFARRTGVGLRVSALLPRPGRLYRHEQPQTLPGNKGPPTTPTAAVILTLLSPVMLVQLRMDNTTVHHLSGIQPHHLLVCNALGIDHAWYEVPSHQENSA